MTSGPSGTSALPPIYPLASLGDAFTRLYFLEKHIRAADKMLARRFTAAIDEMRVRLEREFDPLFSAVSVCTEVLPRLPRCLKCGKVSHETRAGAAEHALTFQMIDELRGRSRMNVFRCQFGGNAWHVGRSKERHV